MGGIRLCFFNTGCSDLGIRHEGSAFIFKPLHLSMQAAQFQRCTAKISLAQIMLVFDMGIKSGEGIFLLFDP